MRKAFALPPGTRMRVTSVNIRREKHGDENVRAADIRFRFHASNHALDMFDTALRAAHYGPVSIAQTPAQSEIAEVPALSDLPALRFPFLGHLTVDHEYLGYRFDVPASGLAVSGCKVNKITLELCEGGTIIGRMRIQATGLGREEYGRASMLLDCDIEGGLVKSDDQGSIIDSAQLEDVALVSFSQPPPAAPKKDTAQSPGKKAAATKAAKKAAKDSPKDPPAAAGGAVAGTVSDTAAWPFPKGSPEAALRDSTAPPQALVTEKQLTRPKRGKAQVGSAP